MVTFRHRHHVAVTMLEADKGIGDTREFSTTIIDLLFGDGTRFHIEREAPQHGCREIHRRVTPHVRKTRHIEHNLVAFLVTVHRVEHVTRVDVEPLHVRIAALARHHAKARRVVVIPADRHVAAHRELEVEHRGQVHEDHVVTRDIEVVHHRRSADSDVFGLHQLARR